MESNEIQNIINNFKDKLKDFGGYFDLDNKLIEIDKLTKKTEDLNFWNNQKEANEVIDKLNNLKSYKERYDNLDKRINSLNDDFELYKLDNDSELLKLIEVEISELESDIESFEILTLLNNEYDINNCVLEIHSGAGGTESNDWVNMLLRMYSRWCDKKGYKYELLDKEPGEEVGLKSVSLLIKGSYAYGYLKCEKGVHRLVRISPFDSNKRRHTTFASVEVTPEFDDKIEIEIKEEDIRVDVYRSSGAGGQGVNTTDSAVRITHIPTKTVVTCQNERSQIKNKEKAMQLLKNKLYMMKLEEQENAMRVARGQKMDINFGSQIRSYVMHPYSMVKDHRTNVENTNVSAVMDGDIDMFIEAYLKEVV
ncbi:MAG: peptide chain release factor 2 [Bacilli bacterium]|nr:peptide chain release factor 2 [Bacilli bacterium]MBQ6282922.1 peptide chain release factor 2 [Bacilli bacterium]